MYYKVVDLISGCVIAHEKFFHSTLKGAVGFKKLDEYFFRSTVSVLLSGMMQIVLTGLFRSRALTS